MDNNFLRTQKRQATDSLTTASNSAIQRTLQTTDNLVGNKTEEKVTKVATNNPKELVTNKISIQPTGRPKERYIPPNIKLLMNFEL